MFAFPVWEVLFNLLWALTFYGILCFLFWGFGELCSRVFE